MPALHASPGAATRGATAHQSSDTCAAHVPCTMARIWWHVPLATAPRRHERAARAPQGVRHKHSLFTMQNLVLNRSQLPALSLEPPSALADLRSPSDLLFRRTKPELSSKPISAQLLLRIRRCHMDFSSRSGPYFSEHNHVVYRQSCAQSQRHTGRSVLLLLIFMLKGHP